MQRCHGKYREPSLVAACAPCVAPTCFVFSVSLIPAPSLPFAPPLPDLLFASVFSLCGSKRTRGGHPFAGTFVSCISCVITCTNQNSRFHGLNAPRVVFKAVCVGRSSHWWWANLSQLLHGQVRVIVLSVFASPWRLVLLSTE